MHNSYKKVLIALLLLSVLFQVQTVFACQMMDHSGPLEQCCCGEMATQKNTLNDKADAVGCCDISSELTVKVGDPEEGSSLVIQSNFLIELAHSLFFVLYPSFWFEASFPLLTLDVWDLKPNSAGTQTYLSTLRLRI
ncbi:hypothetical protein JYU12_02585 [bacterium AH-315-K03]|nr:hypothetical protein [bacterium AH-315-K03]